MTIGAGKILRQKQLVASEELEKDTFAEKESFIDLVDYANEENKKIHVMGLLSDGGVHAHIDHFLKMLEHLKKAGATTFIVLLMEEIQMSMRVENI